MNTKLRLIKSFKSNDNLLFLTERKHLNWLTDSFSVLYMKACINEVSHIFLPREKCNVIIQFLESSDKESDCKEAGRIAGNDILSLIYYPGCTLKSRRGIGKWAVQGR